MAARKKQKFYAILRGRQGSKIYTDWESAKRDVDGFPNMHHKSFGTLEEAKAFLESKDIADGYYGVRGGPHSGVYTSWGEAGTKSIGISGATNHLCSTKAEAQQWVDAVAMKAEHRDMEVRSLARNTKASPNSSAEPPPKFDSVSEAQVEHVGPAVKNELPDDHFSAALPTKRLVRYNEIVALGGFADVRQGILWRPVRVAIKTLRKIGDYARRAAREIAILQKLRHPNIVRFFGFAHLDEAMSLVFGWVHHGAITAYLQSHPLANKNSLLVGVLQGVHYLHSQTPSVVHGDLKGANILVSKDGTPRICDFGLALRSGETSEALRHHTSTHNAHSKFWTPPEAFQYSNDIDAWRIPAGDIYSVAITIVELFGDEQSWASWVAKGQFLIGEAVTKGERPTLHPTWSSPFRDLLELCWDRDPEKRPTAKQVLDIVENCEIP